MEQVQPVAGDAAYQYIKVASELAMAGKVQAICTAPLNKEALHAAGHIFPGHTELLAQLNDFIARFGAGTRAPWSRPVRAASISSALGGSPIRSR